MLPLPWKVLRGKQKAKGCCSAMLRTNWPPPRNRYLKKKLEEVQKVKDHAEKAKEEAKKAQEEAE